MRCLRFGVVALLVFGLLGCRSRDEKDTQGEPGKAGRELAVDPSQQARIQVVFYGLMVFEQENSSGNQRVWALLPEVGGHEPRLDYGKYYKNHNAWEWIPGDWNLDGTISIVIKDEKPMPKLVINDQAATNIDDKPDSVDESVDARWVLHSKEVSSEDLKVNQGGAAVRMLMDSGTFETCGLVHDRFLKACLVKAGNARRMMSEYMVLRWIASKKAEVFVKIGAKEYSVPATGNDDKEKYAVVYDLALTNITPKKSKRDPESPHLSDLQKKFFAGANKEKWSKIGFEAQSCFPNLQPPCMGRYRKWGGHSSGWERPLCPVVGGGP